MAGKIWQKFTYSRTTKRLFLLPLAGTYFNRTIPPDSSWLPFIASPYKEGIELLRQPPKKVKQWLRFLVIGN